MLSARCAVQASARHVGKRSAPGSLVFAALRFRQPCRQWQRCQQFSGSAGEKSTTLSAPADGALKETLSTVAKFETAAEIAAREAEEAAWKKRQRITDLKYIAIAALVCIGLGVPAYILSGLQEDWEMRERLKANFPSCVRLLATVIEIPDDVQDGSRGVLTVAAGERLPVSMVTANASRTVALGTFPAETKPSAILQLAGPSTPEWEVTAAASLIVAQPSRATGAEITPDAVAGIAAFIRHPLTEEVPSAIRRSVDGGQLEQGRRRYQRLLSDMHAKVFATSFVPFTTPSVLLAIRSMAQSHVEAPYSSVQLIAHRKRLARVQLLQELQVLQSDVIPELEHQQKMQSTMPSLPVGVATPRLPAAKTTDAPPQ